MSNKTKAGILHISALIVDIAPPLVATLAQFPIWVEHSSEATISGIVLLLSFICCLPFIKQIIAYFKSPSIPVVWAVIYVALVMLQSIINQIVIVAFTGLVSNIIGAGLYKWGDVYKEKEKVTDKED